MSTVPVITTQDQLAAFIAAVDTYIESVPDTRTSLEIDRDKTRAVMFANRAAYARARRNRRMGA